MNRRRKKKEKGMEMEGGGTGKKDELPPWRQIRKGKGMKNSRGGGSQRTGKRNVERGQGEKGNSKNGKCNSILCIEAASERKWKMFKREKGREKETEGKTEGRNIFGKLFKNKGIPRQERCLMLYIGKL